mgnify:CR=1 FL=1
MDSIESYLRKLIVASVGAADLGCEKLGKLLDECVARGEVTVEKGRVLNEELKRTCKQAAARDADEKPAVDVDAMSADEREALLQKLIAMDDGAAYLGECALVPYDSPINQTGILFYNTLFDENACCHLALGMGFIDTIRDYPNRSLEEMRALGVNDSMIHEDFMIGTPDLAITAHCRDGRSVPVFRDGTWGF